MIVDAILSFYDKEQYQEHYFISVNNIGHLTSRLWIACDYHYSKRNRFYNLTLFVISITTFQCFIGKCINKLTSSQDKHYLPSKFI